MLNRLFIVFAFTYEVYLEDFKLTKNMDIPSVRKIAIMPDKEVYTVDDVISLFDEPYTHYLVYELSEPVDVFKIGITIQMESAS